MTNENSSFAELDPSELGVVLKREADRLEFSVIRISKATGATRQTVYNWFDKSPVAPYYRDKVVALLDIMTDAQTAEQAWRKACSQFQLIT